MEILNIYQMYISNNCRLGFYVHRNSWHPIKYVKVIAIECVEEGKMIEGQPPYFGGRIFPPGHPKAGKIMGPRMVTLEADWMDEGKMEANGGNYSFTQVYPDGTTYSDEEILSSIE
jgi:hypothetical protein